MNMFAIERRPPPAQFLGSAGFLFAGVDAGAYFYFAHSYAVLDSNDAAATCSHGTKFAAVIEQQNIFAVQFHPEKSGDSGARVLQNFLRLAA